MVYSIEQRVFLVSEYFKCRESAAEAVRKFNTHFKIKRKKDGPTTAYVTQLIKKFRDTGSVEDRKRVKTSTVCNEENSKKVKDVIEQNPKIGHRRIAQQVGLKRQSTLNIMKKLLNLFPYKIQVYQALQEKDFERRLRFGNTMCNMIDEKRFDIGKIWFSDEAHFHLEGFVNKQNWRFWASENPYFMTQKPLHSKKLTVWCAISSYGIIGPVFIKGSVTGESYLSLLQEEFITKVQENRDFGQMWFMQDGARPHTTNQNLTYLYGKFSDRVISNRFPEVLNAGIEWPPYSPDLNPCDYFLWGYLKERVYSSGPQNLEQLENAIKNEIGLISSEMISRVLNNFKDRIRHLIVTDGKHFENIML